MMPDYTIHLRWGDSYHRICEPMDYGTCAEDVAVWRGRGYDARISGPWRRNHEEPYWISGEYQRLLSKRAKK